HSHPRGPHSFPTRRSSDLGRNQRLGDLAAGTLVVRERRPAVPAAATYVAPPPAAAPFLEWDVSGVSVEDIATLRQFLERRVSLRDRKSTRLNSSHRTISYA